MRTSIKFFAGILFLLFFSLNIRAQVISTGTDFWMGFTYSFQPGETGTEYKLWISSVNGASGVVSVPLGAFSVPFNVAANSTTVVSIPYAKVQNETSESVQPKGVHIISNSPVSVIASMYSIVRPETSVVMATPALGSDYYVISYPGFWYGQSNFEIVATQNATSIQITPTSKTMGGKAAGAAFTIVLDSGQVYMVRAQDGFTNPGTDDLTGSHIVGTDPCKKFAVFAGAAEVYTPTSCGTADPLYEELQPVSTWGKDFVIPPFYTHTGSQCRIVASQANTSVVIDGGAPITLNAGQFNEQSFNGSAHSISADKPIEVAQYMKGNTCNGGTAFGGSNGDPAMLILNSNDKMINAVTFKGFDQPVVPKHLANVVMKTAFTAQLKLDGVAVTPVWTAVPNATGYSYASLLPTNITDGVTHTIAADSGLIAYGYGYGSGDASYANTFVYSVSPSVAIITGPATVCTGQTITLTATGGGTYLWAPGGATTAAITVSPTVTTTYTVTVTGGCNGTATATKLVTVGSGTAPTISGNNAICAGQSTTLTANPSTTYSWNTGATTSSITVSPTSTTTYTLTESGGCGGAATMQVTVTPVPTPAFTSNITTGCGPLCVQFSDAPGNNCDNVLYNFGDGATSTSSSPLHCYTATGNYSVSISCTKNKCTGTTTTTNMITVIPTPVADFTISPPGAVAPNTEITFTDISTGGGTPSWNFGDPLSSNNTSTLTAPKHTYSNTGDYCIFLISTSSNSCSDTISKCIEVIGDPLIVIPNVFTPNSDGVNDVFYFYTEGVKELSCTIYDRWGLKMSEWNTVTGGWDGRTPSGVAAPDGVYYFTMTATPSNEKKDIIKQQGFLQLLKEK